MGEQLRERKGKPSGEQGKNQVPEADLSGAAEERQGDSPGAACDVTRGKRAEVGRPANVRTLQTAHGARRRTPLISSKAELNQ